MLTNRITMRRNSVTAARILIAKCVLSVNIIIKLLFRIDLIRDVSRINNLTIYLSIWEKVWTGKWHCFERERHSVEGPALSGSEICREKSGETGQLILPVLENLYQAFQNLFSDPTLTHIILLYIIFLQCYRESYRLLFAYKNSQSYTRCKPRNLSVFCCHTICGTLMCIPGIERYKYTHKRAPRSSRAIHCTEASRKQVSIHNMLRQECEVIFLRMPASRFRIFMDQTCLT